MPRDPNTRLYAEVIRLWCAHYDTMDIANRTGVPEHTVARWVANYRDVTRERASA